ncbi:site-specific integrase [Halopiger xanaduensis]|uniref:Bacterio-opsin activator-like protein n=1 Tax=Halopiger xanaduensis (strain DSM 18323 / JCM 14033 / SH-6) TaxID=797210 RepID=F8D4R1_HALXS|nr:site-specific integrase [Halopiger xanaduensis]AEH37530.1 bacterio-opsin activator-like protein [Halopiger xanaduensis SH-6]
MVRIDDSGERTKCWLNYPDEVEDIAKAARTVDWERGIAMRLMGFVGSRASGVPSARPEGINWNSEGEYWELELKGKNTRGGEKKTRDAYLPGRIKDMLDIYADERSIADDEPFVDASTSSIRRWVSEAAEDVHSNDGKEGTRSDRWLSVSSHDLRRSWATHHLVDEDVPVRVMMSIGGWSSYEAIEPYLAKPKPETIGREMSAVQL